MATETALPESELNEPGDAAPRKRFAALYSRNFRILWAGFDAITPHGVAGSIGVVRGMPVSPWLAALVRQPYPENVSIATLLGGNYAPK